MKRIVGILLLTAVLVACHAVAADKKVVFIAGKPSHPPAQHEHRAGCLLLQSCLKDVPGVTSVVYSNGWPTDANAFDGAATVVIYSDGGGGHPFLQQERLKTIGALMDKGVGFEVDTNKVLLLSSAGVVEEIPLQSKTAVAERLVHHVAKSLNGDR